MNTYSRLFLSFVGTAAVAAGCSSSPSPTPGTGGPDGGSVGTGTVLTVTETGWVDKTTNSLNIQGAWYAYGDGYNSKGMAVDGDCQKAGHPTSACSVITAPDPSAGKFMPTGTAMCTKGTAAVVPTANDYTAIWGGGIGLDLSNSGGANAVKGPYDAVANKVIGFSFNISSVPLGGIRVEIPTTETAITAHFKTINTAGPQTVLLSEVMQGSWVTPPTMLAKDKLVSVQFHVPTTMSSAVPYDFCVDKFAAVTQ